MTSEGMAWLRLRGTVSYRRRLATAPRAHGDVETSTDLEDALGRDDGLVVVSGPSTASTEAVVGRAMHLMLGDHALVVVTRAHDADLLEILRRARRLAPVVVHVPDAPPALLARITLAARALVDAQVRLVVTTRPAFLGAVPDDEVVAVVEPATLRLVETADEPDDLSDCLERVSAGAGALARAVAEVDRLGVFPATATAVALLPRYGPRHGSLLTARGMRQAWWDILWALLTPGEGSTKPRAIGRWLLGVLEAWVKAIAASFRHLRLRRAVAVAVRAGLLRRTRGGLRPTPALADHAAAWDPPRDLRKWLREHLGAEEVVTVGLVSLVEGKVEQAASFLGPARLDLVPSHAAMVLAAAAEERGHDAVALLWYLQVAPREDDALAARARRAAGLVGLRVGHPTSTLLPWLEVAGEDESDLEVQEALARRALSGNRRAEARRRFELVAAGGGAAAPEAVYQLAMLASDDGRDAEAEPLLRRAADDSDRLRAFRSRLLLIRTLRRRDRRTEATVAAEETLAWLTDDAPESWTIAVSRELASLRADGGDDAEAVVVLRRVAGGRNAWALAAASDLAAMEARRGNWEAAAAAFPLEVPTVPRASAPDPVLDVADLAVVIATGLAVIAEAAYRRGDLDRAVTAVRELIARGVATAPQILLIGKIAQAVGDVRGAEIYLRKAVESGEATVAAQARPLLEQVEPLAARARAQEEAQLRAEEAARAAARAAMPHFA